MCNSVSNSDGLSSKEMNKSLNEKIDKLLFYQVSNARRFLWWWDQQMEDRKVLRSESINPKYFIS